MTLSLSNSTLKEALGYIAGLCGMTINVEPGAIWLKPMSSGGGSVLIKRGYIVPDAICSSKAQAEKLLKPTIPDFNSPDFFWNFDESSHTLTLQYGDTLIDEFEIGYARELLKHGFQIPVSSPN